MTPRVTGLRLPLLAGLRHHRAHLLRSALAVLGIALGTALLVGIRGALGTATDAFEQAAATLTGRATHVVRGGPSGVPVEVLGRLARELGVRAAAPVLETTARAADLEGRHVLRVFGCDPLAERDVRAWAAGGAGARQATGAGRVGAGALPVGALLTTPGAFVATPAVLARLGVAVGGQCRLRVLGQVREARCVGALAVTGSAAAGLDDVLVVDIATAQRWTGRPRHVGRVDLRLDLSPGVSAEQLAARLGSDLRVEPPPGRAAFTELTRAFRVNLQALGLLSLLVGAFLVHAAMRTAVLARRAQFAVLRTLGGSARQLAATVAIEALVLGALGSLIGLGLGALAASALLAPLTRTLNDHYATFSLHGVSLGAAVLVQAFVLGTLTAVVAALGPAREASRTPPRAVFVQDRMPGPVREARVWWLVAPVAVGVALLAFAGSSIEVAYAGIFLLLLAIAALVPRLVGAMLAALGRLLRGRGPWLAYVLRSAASSRHRTGTAMAALILALAMTIGLGMLIASFRGTVTVWLEQVLPADVYVSVPAGVDERPFATIGRREVAALLQVEGVAAVSRYRRLRLDVASRDRPPEPTEVVALELSPRVLAGIQFVTGDPSAARAGFAAGRGALVAEPLAYRRGLGVGDELLLHTDTGPRTIEVLGVFRDYGSAVGVLNVPMRWFGDVAPNALAFEAAPGLSPDDLEQRIQPICEAAEPPLSTTTQARLRKRSLEMFDRTFAITAALRVMCVLVAFLGIYGAFSALQLERAAELGVLRTLGAGPRHVVGLVLGQTGLLGLCAGLLAIPVGVLLGAVLVHVVNRGSFGWTLLELRLPGGAVLEALVLAVVAALLSGVQPALRFVRLQPVAALRDA